MKNARVRPGQVFEVDKDRAEILVSGAWAEYVNSKDVPKKEKEKKEEKETKELKEVKNEETKD